MECDSIAQVTCIRRGLKQTTGCSIAGGGAVSENNGFGGSSAGCKMLKKDRLSLYSFAIELDNGPKHTRQYGVRSPL